MRRAIITSALLLFGPLSCTFGPSLVEPVTVDPSLTPAPPASAPQTLQSITFGSCNKQNLPQPLWRKIGEEKSDLFIWTGDVVYADTEDMGKLSVDYRQQLRQPEYKNFLSSTPAVIGIYDDHDYGENNGGAGFAPKAQSAQLFLDFIGEGKNSPRRQQEGIYTAYRFGPPGKRVKAILLDTRFHRSEPSPTGDLLGAAQWSWLEKELKKADADLVLLVSSIQVLPFEHRFEKWANFPRARQRLLDLIDTSPVRPILIVSGDRHFAEFSRLTLPSGRILNEVTSSGLTHSYRAFDPSKNINQLRLGPVLTRLNYGLLKIDWAKKKMDVSVRDINRAAIIQETLSF